MAINYSRHRRRIEKMYEDTCTISRYDKVKNPATKQTKSELQTIYSDQPCRISQKALASNDQTETQNTISYQTKLFISPELDIRQGDEVSVTRAGVSNQYQAGEPFRYPTHQEVILLRKDVA